MIGVDNDPERIAALADGRMPFKETGAQEPRRLLPRYLYYNPRFLAAFARQIARERSHRALS